LLNVAVALEQSATPWLFSMAQYVMGTVLFRKTFLGGEEEQTQFCGTPSCALGHYAARRDLQSAFKIFNPGTPNAYVGAVGARSTMDYNGVAVTGHFGVTDKQAEELFSESGCGNAKTAKAAAAYIRKFVARNGK